MSGVENKTFCIECGDVVFIKKYQLCKKCYYKFYNTTITPSHRKTLINNLYKKHGPEILLDIAALNYRQFWNLVDIGNKYGFTREYARRIFKVIYNKPYRKIQSKKKENIKQEIVCNKDPRYKVAEYKEGRGKIGAKYEVLFMEECEKRGLIVAPSCDTVVDFIVNGFFVDVKSATPRYFCKGRNKLYSRYFAREKQRAMADFFACYNLITQSFFIIPKEKATKSGIYIAASKSNCQSAKNKYFEYENAWYLLGENQTNVRATCRSKSIA